MGQNSLKLQIRSLGPRLVREQDMLLKGQDLNQKLIFSKYELNFAVEVA